MKKGKSGIPHTFTIVFFVILVAALLTWLLPGGEFVRTSVEVPGSGTREVVVPGSYHSVGHQWQTWQVFSSLYDGFVRTSHIIVFIFMIGGSFWIVNHTRAVEVGVSSFLSSVSRWQQKKLFRNFRADSLIIILIMLMFSLFGAVFGMSEETLAFMAVFVPLAVSMGYDSLVGMGMCYLAAHVGFAGGMLNPFTIGIAQGLAELPAFSGLGYRFLCWGIFTAAGIFFVLRYASRLRKNPRLSPMYEADAYWRERLSGKEDSEMVKPAGPFAWAVFAAVFLTGILLSFAFPMTEISLSQSVCRLPLVPVCTGLFLLSAVPALKKNVQLFIMDLLLTTILALVVGVLGYGWYIREIAALFLALGILSGIAYRCSLDAIMRLFLEGCKDMLTAALVVGLAGGIIVILQDGKVIDTMLYAMSEAVSGAGRVVSVGGMYLFQNGLNLAIPSGSAKAALTIPIMAPFSDLLDISRQTMVLAFQFGDGITNMVTPASGVLVGCLGVAKVPYSVWMKWIGRWIILLFVIGFLLLLPTLYFPISGF